MSPNVTPRQMDDLRLCAGLADFAYVAGNFNEVTSLDDAERTLPASINSLLLPHQKPSVVLDFTRFHSKFYFNSYLEQHSQWRSTSYFCHLRLPGKEDMILVGFRGTSTLATVRGRDTTQHGPRSWPSKIIDSISNRLAPSTYGLADLYHDATLIRVPYHQGTLWKLYSYWGSLILQRTQGMNSLFAPARKVAAYWMSHPSGSPSTGSPNGHVHLGFWSLWASPEGFAGYDRDGNLVDTPDDRRILQKVLGAVGQADTEGRSTKIYVAGHSLGGAVSCFAALEIAEKLDKTPLASVFHATFGAPPVGTQSFTDYFNRTMLRHQSFSISHCRDLVPQCFAWCGSTRYLGWLGWWNDWSTVGTRKVIYRLEDQAENDLQVGGKDKFIFGGIGVTTLVTLFLTSLVAVPVSTGWYLYNRGFFKDRVNPEAQGVVSGQNDQLVGNHIGIHYHNLQRYINFMGDNNVLNEQP